jgi:hypothetical protein
MSQQTATGSRSTARAPVLWGVVVGLLQAATPLAFWWLDSATVYALGLIVIASVYVGFAVADGRPKVIAVESSVTFTFVVAAAERTTARRAPSGARRARTRQEIRPMRATARPHARQKRSLQV